MMVSDYLKMSLADARQCHVYRMGIEALTERQRRLWSKPIDNESISKVAWLSKELRHALELFFIAGAEPDSAFQEFMDAWGPDLDYKPKVIVKITYLEPRLHTPLANFDLQKIHKWDKNRIYSILAANRRFRGLIGRKDPTFPIMRTLLRRARSREMFLELWQARNKPLDYIQDVVGSKGWGFLWDQAAPSRIRGIGGRVDKR